jgi:hypothetical protein
MMTVGIINESRSVINETRNVINDDGGYHQ